jgi:hypothetical protein
MDLTDLTRHPARLAIVGCAALMIVVFGVRDAQLGSDTVRPDDLLFLLGIYTVPFLVFVFMVWSGRWSELKRIAAPLSKQVFIGFAADVTRVISPGMFLLTLPFWGALASHESLAGAWLLAGVLSSIVAIGCTIAGSPRRWVHAIVSIAMLPCWLFVAAFLAKAAMD